MTVGKIVWARDIGPVQNEKLLAYVKDRWAWVVQPDHNPKEVAPYASLRLVATQER